MIEELTATEEGKLEPGTYRWKIGHDNPFGLLELNLQRKGWLFWKDVPHGTKYPEFHDERRYTSTDEYRERIDYFKDRILRGVAYHMAANKADREFFGSA